MFGYIVEEHDNPSFPWESRYRWCHKRVLITFGIPQKAETSVTRPFRLTDRTACHYTDCADILRIEDAEYVTNELGDGVPYTEPKTQYPTMMIRGKRYSKGGRIFGLLKFYLDPHVAEQADLRDLSEGLLQRWYSDGTPRMECMYKHANREGLYRSWYPDGSPKAECEMLHDMRHGYRKLWTRDGNEQVWYYAFGQQLDAAPKHDFRARLLQSTAATGAP